MFLEKWDLFFSKLACMERKLNQIILLMSDGRGAAQNVAEVPDFSLLPDFPLTTVDQLQACNAKFEDKDIRQLFVSILLKN